MLAGVSTACFYPQYPEEALKLLTSIPVAAAEVFINCREEMEPSYCKELRKIAEEAGTQILSLHPYTCALEPMLFFTEYDRRFREGLELYRKYFEAACHMGAGIVVFHGAFRGAQLTYEDYFERYGRIVEEGRQFGIELCHENVSRCISYGPEFFREMIRLLPEAGCVLDTKQAVRAGKDPMEFVYAMGRNVRHIHISDHNCDESCLPIGRGTFNIELLLAETQKNDFSGGVIVELYRENFDSFVEIKDTYQRLCSHILTVHKNR